MNVTAELLVQFANLQTVKHTVSLSAASSQLRLQNSQLPTVNTIFTQISVAPINSPSTSSSSSSNLNTSVAAGAAVGVFALAAVFGLIGYRFISSRRKMESTIELEHVPNPVVSVE